MHHLKILLFLSIGIALTFSNVYAQNDIAFPLKQLKSGTVLEDIKCKDTFVLIIRESNEHPSCVKPTTITRLLSHGWVTLEKFETTHPVMQHNDVLIPQQDVMNHSINITNQIAINETLPYNNDARMSSSSNNYTNFISSLYSRDFPSVTRTGNALIWVNDVYDPNRQLYLPSIKPLPEVTSAPIVVSSSMPGVIKILSVGMSPNPLKVGDKPEFTITYQNISNKKIEHFQEKQCCLWFGYKIDPQDHLQETFLPAGGAMGLSDGVGEIEPNQIVTDPGSGAVNPDLMKNGRDGPAIQYQITKPGMLTVTMKLALGIHAAWDWTETIQFNVNATQ